MRIAVVGSCGSGKSTIASRLRELGHDAYVVGQEHSEVAGLWNLRSPEAVVYLEVSLDVLRQRRDPNWPEWLFWRQRERLAQSRDAADVVIDTSEIGIPEAIERILAKVDQTS